MVVAADRDAVDRTAGFQLTWTRRNRVLVGPGARVAAAAQAVTGRFTRPEEVADIALFLASDDIAGNITGANVTIDGGFTTETH